MSAILSAGIKLQFLLYCLIPIHKFFSQSIQQLILRYLLHDLAAFDQKTYAYAACDSNICLFRFSWSIYHAAHNGNLNVKRDILHHSFNFIGKTDQVDLGTAAGWTGNDFHASFAESKGFQNTFGGFYLLKRSAGQGNTDGVTDSLI